MRRALIASGVFAAAGLGALAVTSSLATAGEQAGQPSHDRFAAYVADAEAVFGPVEIGASCDDWPDRSLDELSNLTVLPATGEGATCTVVGWAYASPFTVAGLPEAALTKDGPIVRPAIFDAKGNVISRFDSAESTGGSLTREQLAELAELSDWSGSPQP